MKRVAALLALAACTPDDLRPPTGHVLLHVDTDAPVAPPPGTPLASDAAAPLFDRLLVEVFEPGETQPCDGCVAELDIDTDVLSRGGSFAVVPPGPTSGLRVRLRMFLRARLVDGVIAPEATVEVVAALPPVPEEGAVDASLFLPTDAVGFPRGSLEQPVDTEPGAFTNSRVGTWAPAQRRDCAGAPPARTVCVPGGAFFMGHPRVQFEPGSVENTGITDATKQRVVVLAPFFLDAHEATVAEIRASGAVATDAVVFWSGGTTGANETDWCPYTASPDPVREALSMSCIRWSGARQYCQARGGDLPTEVQLEYVMGALQSRLFVWGSDLPDCDDTVWARRTEPVFLACAEGLPPADIGGPVALPSGIDPNAPPPPRTRDRLVLPTGVIFDLAGNQAEFSLDYHQTQDEPCWNQPSSNVFFDPYCATSGMLGPSHTFRGGNWADAHHYITAAAMRRGMGETLLTAGIGLRCAFPSP
ncbi:MAG TPA: SUMF1/EgtB/PvdO family nonheme iron enzyme [Polyangiaceae bacterium]|nr:SUMF1/EgtB/PvdO family nonheme iron enzyme [Polyangiaceae bacterium]